MWIGTYIKWDPIPEYTGKLFDVEALHDDWEGFRIWFRPHDITRPMFIVKFEMPLFYSSSDEGDRLIGANNDIFKEFPHLFWKVSESNLTTEFKRQTGGVRADDDIHHYCFMSSNQCVDVLSVEDPIFTGHENVL